MKKYWKTHTDWIIFIILVIMIAIVLVITNYFRERPELRIPYSDGENSVNVFGNERKPLDPQFPAPSGEERDFYKIYSAGRFQYSIEPLIINGERNPNLDRPLFRVRILNTTDHQFKPSDKELKGINIGCVATENSYKMEPIKATDIVTKPLSYVDVEVSVDQKCVYLGTADGESYWRLY